MIVTQNGELIPIPRSYLRVGDAGRLELSGGEHPSTDTGSRPSRSMYCFAVSVAPIITHD